MKDKSKPPKDDDLCAWLREKYVPWYNEQAKADSGGNSPPPPPPEFGG